MLDSPVVNNLLFTISQRLCLPCRCVIAFPSPLRSVICNRKCGRSTVDGRVCQLFHRRACNLHCFVTHGWHPIHSEIW